MPRPYAAFATLKNRALRMAPILFTRRALLAAASFWVPVVAFVGLAENVLEGDTLRYDRAVLTFINQNLSAEWLTPFMVAFTEVGGVIGVTVITAGAVLLLLARDYRRNAAFVLAVVGGTAAMNVVLKLLFARDRPSLFETVVSETSYSFPSGHAMMSAAMAFTAIVLAWHSRYRPAVIIAAVVYFVTMSFTRLYLGVHYPTDVIAGWCISAAWVAVMYVTLRMRRTSAA